MREIKYRAWSRVAKRMYAISALNFEENALIDIEVAVNGSYSVVINQESFQTIELMQYTGIKDKAGKDIYEGDIVTIGNDPDSTGPVCFDTVSMPINGDEYNYSYTGWYVDTPLERTREYVTQELSMHPSQTQIEIIGNIYEMPEVSQ